VIVYGLDDAAKEGVAVCIVSRLMGTDAVPR
jgi:hypothetical protein